MFSRDAVQVGDILQREEGSSSRSWGGFSRENQVRVMSIRGLSKVVYVKALNFTHHNSGGDPNYMWAADPENWTIVDHFDNKSLIEMKIQTMWKRQNYVRNNV